MLQFIQISKCLLLTLACALSSASFASAEADYLQFCASCHGVSGDAKGKASLSNKMAPPRLTHLQQDNGGYFPYRKVRELIDGRVDKGNFRSHFNSGMPVWGKVFTQLQKSTENLHTQAVVTIRILELTEYIASFQIIDRIRIIKVPDKDE